MSDSHETSSEEEEEEEEEVYPPWLENIVKGEDHYDHVRVLSLDGEQCFAVCRASAGTCMPPKLPSLQTSASWTSWLLVAITLGCCTSL